MKEREHNGYDEYPKTVQEAYERLVNASGDLEYKGKQHKNERFNSDGIRVSFAQTKQKRLK